MTFYEVACRAQSLVCQVAEDSYECNYHIRNGVLRQILQEQVDRAYVLGLMIDAMPLDLAEREV